MALVTTMLSSMQGSGGGGGAASSVNGVILAPVTAASTAALTVTYANGSAGIGATLTNAGAQAAFSLDGATRGVGTRVMIKDQASGLQNGIYQVTTAGSGATNWVLTRTTDFDEIAEMSVGVMVAVAAGTVNAATLWEQTATVTAIGTDDITFTEFANATLTSATIGNLNITGNTISSTNAGGDIVLTPLTTGVVEFGANSTKASRTRYREDTDNGTNYVTWGAPSSLAGDIDFNLPAALPGSNDLVSVCSTAGQFSFGNITGTAAGQADQEAATSLVVPVVPGVQQFHPSAAKFWAEAAGDGASVLASYNLTSITDGGAGTITFTIATDFSSATWSNYIATVGNNNTVPCTQSLAAGTLSAVAYDSGFTTTTDPQIGWCVAGFGDQ